MPVRIGDKAHNFSDPTGLLSECHRRIEMFLRSLEEVAIVIDRPLTEEGRTGLESALRYFREAAPKHTADEEESLFPRLRRVVHPDVESAIKRLKSLEDEHHWAGTLHAQVEELGQQCLAVGNLSPSKADAFGKAVASLASMYKQHIRLEDELVFPLAARMLSDADKLAIAEEMAGRRNVSIVTG